MALSWWAGDVPVRHPLARVRELEQQRRLTARVVVGPAVAVVIGVLISHWSKLMAVDLQRVRVLGRIFGGNVFRGGQDDAGGEGDVGGDQQGLRSRPPRRWRTR